MKLYICDISSICLDMVRFIDVERAAKVGRLVMTDDKKRCIAGGLFTKYFLNGAEIKKNKHGKPYADNGKFFNISHSGKYVLFVLSDNEVGCDIQKIEYIKSDRASEIVFCEKEIEQINLHQDKLWRFTAMWTKKESFLKCVGCGFCRDSKTVDVSGNTFTECGTKYYFRTWEFSDYIISVCSKSNEIPKDIEFFNIGDVYRE